MDTNSKIDVGVNLSIQIVNFRSRHYLKECLFSIEKNLPIGIKAEIIVINNDEKPLGEIQSQENSRLDLKLVEVNKNIGFGKAHNIGFKKSTGKYVLFLNPDTKILPENLENLLSAMEKDEKVGISGPLLVDAAYKIDADCFGADKTPLSIVLEKIILAKKKQKQAGNTFEVGWVSGGAMLVRRDVFSQIGAFDENFFMYFEDVDLCRRARQAGHKVMVNAVVRVLHESGKSFASIQEKKRCYYASQEYYLRKHFGGGWASFIKALRLPYYLKNIWLKRS